MINKATIEIVTGIVRQSLACVPDFEETKFDIDEDHIHATDMRGKYWWKVPIIPNPWPRRRTLLYEALSEIEEAIMDKHDLDVSLYLGAAEPIPAERELASTAP